MATDKSAMAWFRTTFKPARNFLLLARAKLSLRRSWIISKHEGAVPLAGAKRVCIFCTWDRDSHVHDYLIAHLEALKAAGFATIVMVNSKKLSEEALKRLAPVSALVAHRANKGYDFGAYHDGLSLLPTGADPDGVLLMNDSTYGPMFDIEATIFSHIDEAEAQLWALTDSWEDRFHLQSYFVYATRAALKSKAWRKFWRSFLHLDNKMMVVKRYEIGLTQTLVRAGLHAQALFPYRELAREYVDIFANSKDLIEARYPKQQMMSLTHIHDSIHAGVPMNGSHFLWDRLLLKHRCPYIKRELLSHNPTGVPLNGLWDIAVRSVSTYDPDMIEEHLKTITRNRSP